MPWPPFMPMLVQRRFNDVVVPCPMPAGMPALPVSVRATPLGGAQERLLLMGSTSASVQTRASFPASF